MSSPERHKAIDDFDAGFDASFDANSETGELYNDTPEYVAASDLKALPPTRGSASRGGRKTQPVGRGGRRRSRERAQTMPGRSARNAAAGRGIAPTRAGKAPQLPQHPAGAPADAQAPVVKKKPGSQVPTEEFVTLAVEVAVRRSYPKYAWFSYGADKGKDLKLELQWADVKDALDNLYAERMHGDPRELSVMQCKQITKELTNAPCFAKQVWR